MNNKDLKINLLQIFLIVYVFFTIAGSSVALFGIYQNIPLRHMVDTRYLFSFFSEIVSMLILAFIAVVSFLILNNVKKGSIFSARNIKMMKLLAIVSYVNAIQSIFAHFSLLVFNPLIDNLPKLSIALGVLSGSWMLFLALGLLFHILSETFSRAKEYKSEVDLTV